MLTQLIHNGILVPTPPPLLGLDLIVRGSARALTPEQAEMALAWARKKDTPYVRDSVFVANFLRDFSVALQLEPALSPEEVDFGPFARLVDEERAARASLSAEERGVSAQERKSQRDALQARYGYAIVNGQRVELGNYMAEPSGIFMGRGEHPLRGRWKKGACQEDVTLNLSPDAPPVEGRWAAVVWQPQSLWVARWEDKLSGKTKYIWLADTTPAKQAREAAKFDKALSLGHQLTRVRDHIAAGLGDADARRRMVSMACYLIDVLCLRVGDEKDPDEADTVGATTLRPEHVTVHEDGSVEFRFLGKDSVAWHKKVSLPPEAAATLTDLIANARPSGSTRGGRAMGDVGVVARAGQAERSGGHPTRDLPQVFPDISSQDVNAFLSSIVPGLTAKVFRTHHATRVVREHLAETGVSSASPEHAKWQAAILANLEAAALCNHTKQPSANWTELRERFRQRRASAEQRLERAREAERHLAEGLTELRREQKEKEVAAEKAEQRKQLREAYRRRVDRLSERLALSKEKRQRAQLALDKAKAQASVSAKKRTWNLGTSLKSYIDPRVYHRWGQEVGYDVLLCYYPTALQRKFAWVRLADEDGYGDTGAILRTSGATDGEGAAAGGRPELTVRTCTTADLRAVAELFQSIVDDYPEIGYPASLPVEPQEIGDEYLPSLARQDWREAVLALGSRQEALAFAVIGPPRDDVGRTALDLFGVIRPGQESGAVADAVAQELRRRLQAYQAHHPRETCAFGPSAADWAAWAPGLDMALGLAPEEDDTALDEPDVADVD